MKKRIFLNTNDIVGNPLAHYIRFSCYLFIFWLLISGSVHLKFLVIGAVSSLVVAWICMPLFTVPNRSHAKKYFVLAIRIIPLIGYTFWIFKELALANLDVAKVIWKKDLSITPVVLRFQIYFDNPLAIAMLANSITLTPGTVTLNTNAENIYEIHALTPTAIEGIKQGNMIKKVAALFQEDPTFLILD